MPRSGKGYGVPNARQSFWSPSALNVRDKNGEFDVPGQHALAIIEYGNTEIRMSVLAYLLA
jgi:hypothetical protein